MAELQIRGVGIHFLVGLGPLSKQEIDAIKTSGTKDALLSPRTILPVTVRSHIRKYRRQEWPVYRLDSGDTSLKLVMGDRRVDTTVSCSIHYFEGISYCALQVMIRVTGKYSLSPTEVADTLARTYYKDIQFEETSQGSTKTRHLTDVVKSFLAPLLGAKILEDVLADLPYPIIIIHNYSPAALDPGALVASQKRALFGMMVHPAYGIDNLSEKIVQRMVPHNYFYSDLIYQDFHLRGALMVSCTSEGISQLFGRYEAEFVRVFITSRLLWFVFQDVISSKRDPIGILDKIAKTFRGQSASLENAYILAARTYDESSQVYRDLMGDAMTKFGTSRGLDEIASLLESISDESFKSRVEQLGAIATVIGTILAILALLHV